ncbi:SAM-dependent methyltransferase [Actinomadura sp. 3N407]|uniref:SAM-dependent methyltransferase n=1 Tax=Actinomadura sp. 3N407 TaxID=3457423 RepID=UPI003FCD0A50
MHRKSGRSPGHCARVPTWHTADLAGKDNYPVDREAGTRSSRPSPGWWTWPATPGTCSRGWIGIWPVRRGIRQFLDIGTGPIRGTADGGAAARQLPGGLRRHRHPNDHRGRSCACRKCVSAGEGRRVRQAAAAGLTVAD